VKYRICCISIAALLATSVCGIALAREPVNCSVATPVASPVDDAPAARFAQPPAGHGPSNWAVAVPVDHSPPQVAAQPASARGPVNWNVAVPAGRSSAHPLRQFARQPMPQLVQQPMKQPIRQQSPAAPAGRILSVTVPAAYQTPAENVEQPPMPIPQPELAIQHIENESIATPAVRQPETIVDTPFLPELQPVPPDALTLEQLERIALRYNPTLAQAAMAVRAAQGECVQAGLYPNPEIGYEGADVGLEDTSGQQGAVFGQEFVTAGKLRLGRNVAGHELQQARRGRQIQRLKVLNDVRIAYYEVLVAQRTIHVNQQLLNIGEEALKVTQKLRDAQELSEANVLQARIEARTASVSLHIARNRHTAAWRKLVNLLGRPRMEAAPLDGDVEEELPQLDWEGTLNNIWSQSPELAQAWAGVRRAECNVRLQCAERIPNISVGVGTKWDTPAGETLADVGVGIAIPIFDRNQGNITKAQAELIDAKNEVRRVELDLRDRLASAFEEYDSARQTVATYRASILPDAKKSQDMIIAHYPDQFDYLTLLTAQRTYFAVSLEYLDALGQTWSKCIEIDGMLLTGGLEAPGE